jgi:hypothetical protein
MPMPQSDAAAYLRSLADRAPDRFRTSDACRNALLQAAARHGASVHHRVIGHSEEGRPIDAFVVGHGPLRASLVAGAHSDEPVGPETLRTLVLGLDPEAAGTRALFEAVTLLVVPHVNPDGDARNRVWTERWPSLGAYLAGVFREPPGRDVEFGYPAMRLENRAVSSFLGGFGPLDLHMSLHGMGFAEGVMLLVDRHWAGRTQALRDRFVGRAVSLGLALHDHNRRGEKGFFYIEPGFWTTPEAAAMRAHFLASGDSAMAERFHDTSMEFARSLGGDPLCLVTELPLFMIRPDPAAEPGEARTYARFKDRQAEFAARALREEDLAPIEEEFGIRALPLEMAVGLQLHVLADALAFLQGYSAGQ